MTVKIEMTVTLAVMMTVAVKMTMTCGDDDSEDGGYDYGGNND